jgi:hypothetical protein
MEISKQKLLRMLSENNYISDIEEMAKFWTKKKPGVFVKASPLYDNDVQIGFDMMVNPFSEDPDSERVQIIFTCNFNEFEQKHPEVIEKLLKDFPNLRWTNEHCVKYNPHNKPRMAMPLPGKEGEPITTVKQTKTDRVTGEKVMGSEKIKTKVLKILRNELLRGGDNINDELDKRSIPGIVLDSRKHFDLYTDTWTNNKVTFRTTSFNTYESGKDFLQKVVNRIGGKSTEQQNTDYMSRQWNTKYRKYLETKKSDTEYQGKTPMYGKDVRDYKEGNFDVSMKMLFEVEGEKIGDSFIWTISLLNKFGRKRPDQARIEGSLNPIELVPGGVLDEKKLVKSVSIQLDPNTNFTPENTIVDNESIVNGLIEAIDDFKDMIKNISPKSLLKYATIKRSDIEKIDEGKISKLIKGIINKKRN